MIEPQPLRPSHEVAGAFITLTLAGEERQVRVLPIRANREWQALFNKTVEEGVTSAGGVETWGDVMALLAGSAEKMLDLIVAYDKHGSLPDREWLLDNAGDIEVYDAIKIVTAVAFPFGSDLMKRLPDFKPIIATALMGLRNRQAQSRSTSGSRRSTAGRPRRSKIH